MSGFPTETHPLQPPGFMQCVINCMRAILIHRMTYQPQAFLKYYSLVTEKRLFLSSDDEAINRMWDGIRRESDLTDFVIELTSEFLIKASDYLPLQKNQTTREGHIASLIAELVALVGAGTTLIASEGSSIEEDLLKIVGSDNIPRKLKDNPWLLCLRIAQLCDIEDEVSARNLMKPPETKQ